MAAAAAELLMAEIAAPLSKRHLSLCPLMMMSRTGLFESDDTGVRKLFEDLFSSESLKRDMIDRIDIKDLGERPSDWVPRFKKDEVVVLDQED